MEPVNDSSRNASGSPAGDSGTSSAASPSQSGSSRSSTLPLVGPGMMPAGPITPAAPAMTHGHGGGESESDLQRYLRVIRERRWTVLATLVLGALSFAWWAHRQPRIYAAATTIVVDATPPQVMGGDVRDVVQVGPGQYWQMQDYLQTQRRVLSSDRLAARVVKELRLDRDTDFWPDGLPADADEAAHWFIDAVSIEAVPDTQIIAVTYRHRSPAQAKRAADGLVDMYIVNNEAWRDTSNASASSWLAGQSDELRKKLASSELALYEFKRSNDLLSVSIEERANNLGRQIDKLSDALTEARLRRVSRDSEAEELQKMNATDPEGISPASASAPLEAIKAQLIDEERKLSELKARYEDPHPLVRQQAAKVQAMRQSIQHETARLIRGAKARTNEAIDEEQRIAKQLEAAKQEGLRITRLEVDYNKLKREADALAKQYVLVESRTKETELASKIKVNNLHVLDYSRVPEIPVSPHLVRSGEAALVLSLLVGILFALLRDALDNSLKTHEDVEQRLGLPLLGMVPRVPASERSDLTAAEDPRSAIAESCRAIRTNLLYAGLKTPLRRILVTSSLAREGKTLTTVSLGVVMAQAGNRVLLVDSDLRSPRLRAALGLKRDVGLTDVLLGLVTLEEAIQPTGVPNLSVLLSGGVPPNPAEVIDGPRFRELLDACSARYERVLLDSPPMLLVTDPAILAAYCDGALLVVRSRKTSVAQARRARRILTDIGARLLGVVLNDVIDNNLGYGYGYGYGYGRNQEGGERRTDDGGAAAPENKKRAAG